MPLTSKQVAQLENIFEIRLPDAYRDALIQCPIAADSESFVNRFDDLVEFNKYFREANPWPFPWLDHFWWIGGDGCGGFHFLSCQDGEATVYYFVHDEPAKSFDDRERLRPDSLTNYIAGEVDAENECREYEVQLVAERALKRQCVEQQIANRKWWQFWIPKSLPRSMKDW